MPSYQTAFEIKLSSFNWWLPFIGMALFLVGLTLIWFSWGKQWNFSKKFFGYFITLFGVIVLTASLATICSEYSRLYTPYKSGRFEIVQGVVRDFQAMPYEGHANECFSVQFRQFCYSDYDLTLGFHNARSHGGPIREGLPVRVAYIGNVIVRLEIADGADGNALP